jgi:diaminobutyrate-2-oxoglutarate transaminase
MQYEDAEDISNQYESNVRCYARKFQAVFDVAKGSYLYTPDNRKYLDFFSGAGSLNYGHNHPLLKQAILDYVARDGVSQCLDMHTLPKIKFIREFQDTILKPRDMRYKLMFTGPTGANVVEAALKLARKVTKRGKIYYFNQSYHGLSLGALAVSDSEPRKKNLEMIFHDAEKNIFGDDKNYHASLEYLNKKLSTCHEDDLPAAFIFEVLQGEGGLNQAHPEWIDGLVQLAHTYDILIIVDDIQVGCGRTGRFFSFEDTNLKPDFICLSKSLSGYGYPLSLLLIKPELDEFYPGEHSGTFRSNALSLVTANKAIELWQDKDFYTPFEEKIAIFSQGLYELAHRYAKHGLFCKGRGFAQGLSFNKKGMAETVSSFAFNKGLLIEVCGPQSEVLKCLPALTIDINELKEGLDIIEKSIQETLKT